VTDVVVVELSEASIEALTVRFAAALADVLEGRADSSASNAGTGLLDAAAVALRYGLSRDWVYEHADELGVIRLGAGRRPRLRFDPERVSTALAAARGKSVAAAQIDESAEADHRSVTRRRRRGGSVELLPIGGAAGVRSPATTEVAGRRANAPGRGAEGMSSGAARTVPARGTGASADSAHLRRSDERSAPHGT
jgi:hypothetical protein